MRGMNNTGAMTAISAVTAPCAIFEILIPTVWGIGVVRYIFLYGPNRWESLARFDPPGPGFGTPTPGSLPVPGLAVGRCHAPAGGLLGPSCGWVGPSTYFRSGGADRLRFPVCSGKFPSCIIVCILVHTLHGSVLILVGKYDLVWIAYHILLNHHVYHACTIR